MTHPERPSPPAPDGLGTATGSPYRPCDRCNGTGRIATEDLELLARLAWEQHKNDEPYPHIRAIKRLRELTGMGLRDAKDLIDATSSASSPESGPTIARAGSES